MPPRGDVEARLAGLLKLAESGDVAQDPGGDLSYLLIQLYSFIIIYIYIYGHVAFLYNPTTPHFWVGLGVSRGQLDMNGEIMASVCIFLQTHSLPVGKRLLLLKHTYASRPQVHQTTMKTCRVLGKFYCEASNWRV